MAGLTDFAYNVGEGQFSKSTLVNRINKGEDVCKVVTEELPRWKFA